MNQAQSFDHVMQVVELDKAKAVTPGRATEIETFEKSIKDIMAAYLNSLEINASAEARIREQVPLSEPERTRPLTSCVRRSSSFRQKRKPPKPYARLPRAAKKQPSRRWSPHSAPLPIRSASTPC